MNPHCTTTATYIRALPARVESRKDSSWRN